MAQMKTWDQYKSKFKNEDFDSWPIIVEDAEFTGDKNKVIREALEKSRKQLHGQFSEQINAISNKAKEKGLTLYVEPTKNDTLIFRFVPTGEIVNQQTIKQLQQDEKVIRFEVSKFDQRGRGMNQHVKVQNREVLTFDQKGEIISKPVLSLGLEKVLKDLERAELTGARNTQEFKKQFAALTKRIQRDYRRSMERVQALSANRAQNIKKNADSNSDFNGPNMYTEVAQFYSSLAYDYIPFMNDLWEYLRTTNTSKFRQKYGRYNHYKVGQDVVQFQRDFNKIIDAAIQYADIQDGEEAFAKYLAEEQGQFGAAQNQLMNLFKFFKAISPTYGMRQEGATGQISLAKINSSVLPFISKAERKPKQNALGYAGQKRNLYQDKKGYAFENKIWSSKIAPGNYYTKHPGLGALYYKGEITEGDLKAAYQEFFKQKIPGIIFDKDGSISLNDPTIRAKYNALIKKHPVLANYTRGLTSEMSIYRASMAADFTQEYLLPQAIKKIEYQDQMDQIDIELTQVEKQIEELKQKQGKGYKGKIAKLQKRYFLKEGRDREDTKRWIAAARVLKQNGKIPPFGSIQDVQETDEGLDIIVKQIIKDPLILKLLGGETAGVRTTGMAVLDEVFDLALKHAYGNSVTPETLKRIGYIRQRPDKIKSKNIYNYLKEALYLITTEAREKGISNKEIAGDLLGDWFELSNNNRLIEKPFAKGSNIDAAIKSLNNAAQTVLGYKLFEGGKNGEYSIKNWIGMGQLLPASNQRSSDPNNIRHGFKEIDALENLYTITGNKEGLTSLNQLREKLRAKTTSTKYGYYQSGVEGFYNRAFMAATESSLKEVNQIALDQFKDFEWIDKLNTDAYLKNGDVRVSKQDLLKLPSYQIGQKILDDIKKNQELLKDGKIDWDNNNVIEFIKKQQYGLNLGSYTTQFLNGKLGKAGFGAGSIMPIVADLNMLQWLSGLGDLSDSDMVNMPYSDLTRLLDSFVANINETNKKDILDIDKVAARGDYVRNYGTDLSDIITQTNGYIFDLYNTIEIPGSRMFYSSSLRTDIKHDFELNDKNWIDQTYEHLLSLDQKVRSEVLTDLMQTTRSNEKGILTDDQQKIIEEGGKKGLRKILEVMASRVTAGSKTYNEEAYITSFLHRFPSITGLDVFAAKGKLVSGVNKDYIALAPFLQRLLNADDDGDIIAAILTGGKKENFEKLYKFTEKAKAYSKVLMGEDLGQTAPTSASKSIDTMLEEFKIDTYEDSIIAQQVQAGKKAIGEISNLNTGVRRALRSKGLTWENADPEATHGGLLGAQVLSAFLTTLEQDALSAKKVGDLLKDKKQSKGTKEMFLKIEEAKELIKEGANWSNAESFKKILGVSRQLLGKTGDKSGETILNARSLALLASAIDTLGGKPKEQLLKMLGFKKTNADEEEIANRLKTKGISDEQIIDLLYGENGLNAILAQKQDKNNKNDYNSISSLVKNIYQGGNIPGKGVSQWYQSTNFDQLPDEVKKLFMTGEQYRAAVNEAIAAAQLKYNTYSSLIDWANDDTLGFNKILQDIQTLNKNPDLVNKLTLASPHTLLDKYLPTKYDKGFSQEFVDQIMGELRNAEDLSGFFEKSQYNQQTISKFYSQQKSVLRGKLIHSLNEFNSKQSKQAQKALEEITGKNRSDAIKYIKGQDKNIQPFLMEALDYQTLLQAGNVKNLSKEMQDVSLLAGGVKNTVKYLKEQGFETIGKESALSGFLGQYGITGMADIITYKKGENGAGGSLLIGDLKTNAGGITSDNILQTLIYANLARELYSDIHGKSYTDLEAYLNSGSALSKKLQSSFAYQARIAEKNRRTQLGENITLDDIKESDKNVQAVIKKMKAGWAPLFATMRDEEIGSFLGSIIHASPTSGDVTLSTFEAFGSRGAKGQGAINALLAGTGLTESESEELKTIVQTAWNQKIEGWEKKYNFSDIKGRLNDEQKESLKNYLDAREQIKTLNHEREKLTNQLLDLTDEELNSGKGSDLANTIKDLDNKIHNLAQVEKPLIAEIGAKGVSSREDLDALIAYEEDKIGQKHINDSIVIDSERSRLLHQKYERDFRKGTQLLQTKSQLEKTLENPFLNPEERDAYKEQLKLVEQALATTGETLRQLNNKLESLGAVSTDTGDELKKFKEGLEQERKDALKEDEVKHQIQNIRARRASEARLSQTAKKIYGEYWGTQADIFDIEEQLKNTKGPLMQQLLNNQLDAYKEKLVLVEDQLGILKEDYTTKEAQNLFAKAEKEAKLKYDLRTNKALQRTLEKEQGGAGGGLFGGLGDQFALYFKRIMGGGIVFKGLQKLRQEVQKVVAQARDLDKVMTNVRIVTNDSTKSTRDLMSSYSNLGKEIGATTKEVAQSGIEWMRQGYEAAEANKLIKASLYLSKLGMIDSTTATKSLTSALKGFKLEASEAMSVVDKLTAIDLKAATSAGDIAEGLSQFANLGSLAGVDIDQAAAYVATIADVTQMSGSSAGTALKTIISRYSNVKAGAYNKLNVDSESSDTGENLNDVEKVLNKIGISIRSTNLEFKDFDEVLAEIAEKWNTLDNVSKKAIANAFAGKNDVCSNPL